VQPERLYHPVLPFRRNKKLMFVCVEHESSEEESGHTADNERALTGTWVMDEGRLAVEKGYKICEIYQLYE